MNNVIRFRNTYYLAPPTINAYVAKRVSKPYRWQRKQMNNVLIKLIKTEDWEYYKEGVKLEEYKEPQSFCNEPIQTWGTWSTTTAGTWLNSSSNYYDY